MDPVSQLSSNIKTKSDEKVRQKSLIDSMVVLLNSNESNEDYIQEIQSKCEKRIEFIEICPIQFDYINGQQLSDALLAVDNWSAICLTSKRCVDALRLTLSCDKRSQITDLWLKSKKLVFVVGIKSYEYLRATLGWEAIGSQCGNSDNLAKLMITEYKHKLSAKPVLYPCSQSRSDYLPQTLTNSGIAVNEIVVYQTIANKDLGKKVIELKNRLKDCLEKSENVLKLILIFFSPSGFQSFNPFLSEYIIKNEKIGHKLDIKYVAIGGTTGAALRQSSLNVWFISPKPNPQSLAQALSQNLQIMCKT